MANNVVDGKLHVVGADGVTKDVTLYTSTENMTKHPKEMKYKGEIVYAATTTDPDSEYATAYRYKDTDGVTRYLATEAYALEPTDGTVSISGALTYDLVVNGNITVSGAITADVVASGTVTCSGNITGTVRGGATLYSCDLQVSGGTLTFAAAVSESDGGMYTTGQVTNNSANTATVFGRLTISGTANNILYNNGGTFTVANGAYVSATTSYGSLDTNGYTTTNTNSGTLIVESGGELMSIGTGTYTHGGQNASGATIKVYGKATFKTPNAAVGGGGTAYDGFRNQGTFIVGDGGDVTIYGEDEGLYSYGSSAITIEKGGKMDVTGTQTYGVRHTAGTITVEGKLVATDPYSGGYGIYSTSTFTLNSTGVVTATGAYGFRNTSTTTISGTLTAVATNASYYALYNTSTMTVTDTGKVHAYNSAGGGVIYNSTTNLKVQDGGQILLTAAPEESEGN